MEIVKSPIDIEAVIAQIKADGMNQGVQRCWKPYNMFESLELVKAIGKARDPKFVIDDYNKFTFENFIKWAHGDTTMEAIHPVTRQIVQGRLERGIYIAGNTGSGKTWCMDVMLEYMRIQRIPIKFRKDKMPTFLYWTTRRADEIVARFIDITSIDDFKRCPILCIQDLGAEPLEAVSMGNRMNVLRNLIEYRGDRRDCLTMFTSNIPIDHEMMRNAYDDRVSSRLMEMCNYFEIKGIDRRKI